ncbi:hypothetical protein CRT60_00475 [Azospirillum palustre]|uniref:Uncharacterized protein n=1 Tax=Azospirillum palustre TaxID=2044885 RepID=A0A2B8BPU3_9PROT|nr:hypothetical protein [Azospirillum palustre]PGH59442.1 hypothetical protein CRT60_00475 [Azospirillum palustre]
MSEADAQPVEGGIPISTAGPLSVHHLLLHLASDHRVTVHDDVAEIDHGDIAAAALEIWQAPPSGDGARWRWYLLRQGRVVEEAPHDPHRLRPFDGIMLTVTHSTLPDRDSVAVFRKALRAAGATCTLSRPVAVRSPDRERIDA